MGVLTVFKQEPKVKIIIEDEDRAMRGAREANQPNRLGKRIKDALVWLITVLLPLLPQLSPLAENAYQSYIVPPKIQYFPEENYDHFKVPDDFRAVVLRLDVQMIIQCDINVISIISLENYYEDNVIIFDGTSGVAKKENQTQVAHLRNRINQELQKKLMEKYGEEIFEKIGPLKVDVSLLGGVKYQNLRGNPIHRQCIIGQDSLVQDYSEDRPIIKKRVNTIQLEVKKTTADIDEDEEVEEIIQDAAERIETRLINGTGKKLSDYLARVPALLYWIAFLICAIVAIAMAWISKERVKYYFEHRRSRGRRKSLFKILCVYILVMVAADGIGFITAKALTATEDEKLIYEASPLAEQRPVESLFDSQRPEEEEEEEEEASYPSTLEKLHILSLFVGVETSQSMLSAYRDEMKPFYKNGIGTPPKEPLLPEWFDMDSGPYAALSEAARDDIEEQVEKCSNYTNPANLYQLERALTDGALLEYSRLDFEDLLDIAADAIACGELFLTYANRNINSEKEPVFINAEDVALLNGKLYWLLGDCVEHGNVPQEYRQYKNSFYAAGFQCMALGREQIDESDLDYAKMSYYMGNLSERMLIGLAEKDVFFHELGDDSMRYYEKALNLLENGSVKYHTEENMEHNIQKGISTLKGLGFVCP